MSKITTTQLDETQLKRLAAQRQLYSQAKTHRAFQMTITILSPLVVALVVALFFWSPVLTPIASMGATIASILWLTPKRESLQSKAAKIQEMFDREVLALDWNKPALGSSWEMETVEKYADKYRYKHENFSELENWYPEDVGKLPVWLGRIVCQRANCWWEADMRRCYASYVNWFLSVIVLLFLILCFVSACMLEWSLEAIIRGVVAPFNPAFIVGIYEYRENRASVIASDKLKHHSEHLWEKAIEDSDPKQLTCDSRELQDQIYNHRRQSPLVFRVYKRLRDNNEKFMKEAADDMVNKALESGFGCAHLMDS